MARLNCLCCEIHPTRLGDGGTFFGMLDEPAAKKWRALIGQRKQEVEDLEATLAGIDSLDFAPFLTMKKGDGAAVADEITKLFRRAAPGVYRYYYFLGLLRAWEKESVHPSIAALRAAIADDEAYM